MDEQLLGELRKWLELPRVSVINPKQAKQLIGTVKALRAHSTRRKIKCHRQSKHYTAPVR